MSSQGNRHGKPKKEQKQNSNNKNAPGEKRGLVFNNEVESLCQPGTTQQAKPQGSKQSLTEPGTTQQAKLQSSPGGQGTGKNSALNQPNQGVWGPQQGKGKGAVQNRRGHHHEQREGPLSMDSGQSLNRDSDRDFPRLRPAKGDSGSKFVEDQASGTQQEYSVLPEHNQMKRQISTHRSTSIAFEIGDLSTCANCNEKNSYFWEILKEMMDTHPNKDLYTGKLRTAHAMKCGQPEHQTSRGLSADAAEFKQKAAHVQPEYDQWENTDSSMQSSSHETITNNPLVDCGKDDDKMDACSTPEEEWEDAQEAFGKKWQEGGSQSDARRTSGDRQQKNWGRDKGSHSSERGSSDARMTSGDRQQAYWARNKGSHSSERGHDYHNRKQHNEDHDWRRQDNGRQHNDGNQQGPRDRGGSKYDHKGYKIVKEKDGDLFEAPKETSLAHCVATDMRMGSGIAVNFRQTFKSVTELLDQRARVGQMAVLEHENRFIYYLVTKRFSNGKPMLEDLLSSLEKMRDHCAEHGVKCLAMPRIGCGLDRLEWRDVKPKIEEIFSGLDISITVYNFNQPEKEEDNYSRKRPLRFKNRLSHLVEMESQTALIFCGFEDGYVDECGKELDNKFHFMQDFRTQVKKVGNVIRLLKRDEVLYGLIVGIKQNDVFSYINFEKCLIELRKLLKKDEFLYVGFQAFRAGEDLETMEKIITVLKNVLTPLANQLDIYVCWPKLFEVDCRGEIDVKP